MSHKKELFSTAFNLGFRFFVPGLQGQACAGVWYRTEVMRTCPRAIVEANRQLYSSALQSVQSNVVNTGNFKPFCHFCPKLPCFHIQFNCNANVNTISEKGYSTFLILIFLQIQLFFPSPSQKSFL